MRRIGSKKRAKKAVRKAKGVVARRVASGVRRSSEKREDALLAAEARKALADPENREHIPWEKLKTELGL